MQVRVWHKGRCAQVRLGLVLALTVGFGACGGGGGSDATGAPVDATIASLVITDGNGQTATVGTELQRALVVRAVNANGAAVSGAVVTFRVTDGGGTLFAGASTSDAGGLARERWTLGLTASQAQRVEARAVGAGGAAIAATFNAVAVAGPAARLVVASGANQSGMQAQALASSVVIAVQDAHANPVAGTSVSLAVNNGGSVTPASAQSDATGQVRADWTLGVPIGVQRLTATAGGLAAVEVQATATQAPPGAPARIVVSLGDGQTVLQHAQLGQPLEAWVTDALGNAVPGVTVTFAPVAGGPYFRAGSALTDTARDTGYQGGYARWRGYFHTAGTQLVEASVSPGVKVTFTVNVTPFGQRFDGVYDCDFAVVRLDNTPFAVDVGMEVVDGIVSGGMYGYPSNTLADAPVSEVDGSYSSRMRMGLDGSWIVSGTFSMNAQGPAVASGTIVETRFGGPDGVTGTWTCQRD